MELKKSKEPKEPKFSELTFGQKIYAGYIRGLRHITRFFRRRNMDLIGDAIVCLLAEPVQTIKTAHFTYIGNVPIDQFHHFDLNPPLLSHFEDTQIVTLLIHGAGTNQGMWYKLAKILKEEGAGPVFTVNMPKVSLCNYERKIRDSEKKAINKRLNEIRQLFLDQGKLPPQLIVVGHSRGGDIAHALCDEHDEIIKVVRIGKVTPKDEVHSKCLNRLHEIAGEFDAICHWRSQLSPENRSRFNAGHIGLIYNKEVHKKITSIIKSEKLSDL